VFALLKTRNQVLPNVSVKPRLAERTTCPFCIRPHNIGTLAGSHKRAVEESSDRLAYEFQVD
jgi:hypothetical protein